MNEFKGTPGPWAYAPDHYYWDAKYTVWTDKGPEHGLVASTSPNSFPVGREEECAANARLIAAVPALLAACEALLTVIHDSDQRQNPSAMRMLSIVSGEPEFAAVDAARAAIAKAKGESP